MKISLPFDSKPPAIAPVQDGVHRPLWSVMIPAFNCAKYLQQTLESVLAQDQGSDQMQIEVVDDCSTTDDPKAVVEEVGKGRVAFHRKPKNEGAITNFNACIQRTRFSTFCMRMIMCCRDFIKGLQKMHSFIPTFR